MHIKITAITLAALAVMAQPAAAVQVVVGFEDISADWELVDGYGGISGWAGFGQLSVGNFLAIGSNLVQAREGSLHFDSAPVVFEGLYINYWVSNGIVSPFSLLYQGTVVHSVFIDSESQPFDTMVWLASGYAGPVDEIRFNYAASDGFIVDNLTYSALAPVPEPATVGQFAAGLALLGGLAWRRSGSKRSRVA